MTAENFIQALKAQTSDSALFGEVAVLHRPPGRKPSAKDIALSTWYNGLSEADQGMVFGAMKEAAELAVFSLLCILDGVSAIEDDIVKGDLQLIYKNGPELTQLNDARSEPLHDMYNRLCRSADPFPPQRDPTREYATGLATLLRSLQTSRDGLDIQPIPSQPYSQGDGPAIALPKEEHRKF